MGGTSWVGPAVKLGMAGYAAYSGSKYGNRTRGQKAGHESVNATTLSRSRYKFGKKKRRSARSLFNSVVGRGDVEIWRWQQTSNSILGPGRLPLGWMQDSDPNFEYMPFNWLSITQLPKGNQDSGTMESGMKKIFYDKSNGEFAYGQLVSQLSTGADSFSHDWQPESTNFNGSQFPLWSKRIYHAWTDIRFNLYGALRSPITYTILVYQCKKEFDIQDNNPMRGDSDASLMLKDWLRPCMGNTIASNGRQDWTSGVRIVKKIVKTIQPLSYSDQTAQESNAFAHTGHVHEVKIFMRHDRFRDYHWRVAPENDNPDRDFTTIGWDVTNNIPNIVDCGYGNKLYLAIMATSPRREDYNVNWATHVDNQPSWANCQGSYDVCVRNKFVYF